jgi:hypothetical protein
MESLKAKRTYTWSMKPDLVNFLPQQTEWGQGNISAGPLRTRASWPRCIFRYFLSLLDFCKDGGGTVGIAGTINEGSISICRLSSISGSMAIGDGWSTCVSEGVKGGDAEAVSRGRRDRSSQTNQIVR